MHGRSIATVDHAQNIHGMDIPQGKLNHFFLAFNCRFHGIIQNVIQKDGKFRILNIIQIGGFNLIEKPNAFLFADYNILIQDQIQHFIAGDLHRIFIFQIRIYFRIYALT